jgi:hypothetical protein
VAHERFLPSHEGTARPLLGYNVRVNRPLLTIALVSWAGCFAAMLGFLWYATRLWWHHIAQGDTDWLWGNFYTWSRIIHREPEPESSWETRRRRARILLASFGGCAAGAVAFIVLATVVG